MGLALRNQSATIGVQSVGRRIGNEIRQVRIRKIRVIENVEEVRPDLEIDALGQSSSLRYRKIQFLESRGPEGVATHIAEVARPGETIAITPASAPCRIAERARHLEGSE